MRRRDVAPLSSRRGAAARATTRQPFRLGAAARAASPAARRLYERPGFVARRRKPEATVFGGRRIDEIHAALRLEPR